MVNEHLTSAIEELEQAREKAPLGTQMMIDEAIQEVSRVRNTFDNE